MEALLGLQRNNDEVRILHNIHNELKRTNDRLMERDQHSKDGVKYMVWYKDRKEHITVFVRVSFVSIGDIDAVIVGEIGRPES